MSTLFAINPSRAGEIIGRMIGCPGHDAHLNIEIRDQATGFLIGWGFARHSWDGERAVDGFVEDPWIAAADAVAMARAWLAAPCKQAFWRGRLEMTSGAGRHREVLDRASGQARLVRMGTLTGLVVIGTLTGLVSTGTDDGLMAMSPLLDVDRPPRAAHPRPFVVGTVADDGRIQHRRGDVGGEGVAA